MQTSVPTRGGIRGQALLVAGSAVGAGLIALPSVTCRAGFIPSSFALVAVWAYMSCVGVLLLEASSWMDDRSRPANLSGVVSYNLGSTGRPICILLYISIYSATITAYIAEGGQQATELLIMLAHCIETQSSTRGECVVGAAEPSNTTIVIGKLIFTAIFCGIIFKGPRIVERVNAVCMCGAILVFLILVHTARYDKAVDEVGELSIAENATNTDHIYPDKSW
eukprot:8087148-Ditylum_brightwellii.AAC.1